MTTQPIPKQVILIRVAVDHSFGHWNGPCNPVTGDFVYVPIPQQNKPNADGMDREYVPMVSKALRAFSTRNGVDVRLPVHLYGQRMHLDPDFDHLTYGDTAQRGRKLLQFQENDWVVFYSGLRSIHGGSHLIYGLIGLLVINSVRQVSAIPASEYDDNAHTRYLQKRGDDIVVTGKPGVSGRFASYLDIGEFRNGSYRVRLDVLETWGGLGVKDGWIQRSANPPLFLDPIRFATWLQAMEVRLLAANNPDGFIL